MPRTSDNTGTRILTAASKLFYSEGIRAVSLDNIADAAKVTKRTIYYHFRTKDDLVAAYLAARDQPNLALFRKWHAEATGGPAEKVRAIFRQLAKSARHPKWKGCGFLRTSAELANMPGHPAIRIGAAHKKRFETWMSEEFTAAGVTDPAGLARHVLLLLDGSFAVVLLHRDAAYMEAAGDAAFTLVRQALGKPARGKPAS